MNSKKKSLEKIRLKNKRNLYVIVGMIPWFFLMILYFIWANQNGFSISKNGLGAILVTCTGFLYYSVVAFFTDAMIEENNVNSQS